MPQYFDNVEGMEHQNITIKFELLGESYSFFSDKGVFSKNKLDFGTELLLKTVLEMNPRSPRPGETSYTCGY